MVKTKNGKGNGTKAPAEAQRFILGRSQIFTPEVINDIQRHLAKQQYYVSTPSGVAIAVWDGALKNYGPNVGYDYGGRVAAAWLER